jgi:hypothetical protein
MDGNVEQMTTEQLIEEIKKLRAGSAAPEISHPVKAPVLTLGLPDFSVLVWILYAQLSHTTAGLVCSLAVRPGHGDTNLQVCSWPRHRPGTPPSHTTARLACSPGVRHGRRDTESRFEEVLARFYGVNIHEHGRLAAEMSVKAIMQSSCISDAVLPAVANENA